MKRFLLGVGALGVAVVLSPLFAAFEAHVINVTAKIENALSVKTEKIDFGTVFPQEHLDQPLNIALSGSFLDEDRVDDVEYFIRQKPKCGITTHDGTVLVGETTTGHIVVATSTPELNDYTIDCGPAPRELAVDDTQTTDVNEAEVWGVLPSLCEYISKEPDGRPQNDGTTPSFHKPWTIVNDVIQWLDTPGRLAKSEDDTTDDWIIDLAVPCFGGFCAQDWDDFVHGINPTANPDDYTQDIEQEHKIFGCDLWVEVSGVSEAGTQPVETTLTLAKTVLPALLHPDSAYTLTASSTDTSTVISGIEGAGSVTAASVAPGTYALSETDGGFPGAIVTWSCIGNATPEVDNLDGTATVTVAAGESVGCDVTNTYEQTPPPTGP